MKKWCQQKTKGYFIFTSNVDNQFQKAGFDENKIVECHGSLSFLQTLSGCGKKIWAVPQDWKMEIDDATLKLTSALPKGPPGFPSIEICIYLVLFLLKFLLFLLCV